MTSRRDLILASGALALPSLPAFAAKSDFIEGKDYTVVRPPVAYDTKPLLVHVFFAYTCPHCLRFEPEVQAFIKDWSHYSEVRIVPVPVSWSEIYDIFPKVYYTFEQMGRLGDLHMAFWEWVIKESHDSWVDAASTEKDIIAWATRNGLTEAEFTQALASFSVAAKTRQASQTWRHYGVDATPNIGIGGKYLTAPHLAGTRKRAIRCAEFLIKRELDS